MTQKYMARWGVWVDADDPVDAAKKAGEVHRNNSFRAAWYVCNLDTGESFAVDLEKQAIVEERTPNGTTDSQDSVVVWFPD